MLKRLAILAVFTCLPIYGQKEGPKASHDQKDAHSIEQARPVAISIVNSASQPAPQGQQDGTQNHSANYLDHLILPETLASIGLLILGGFTLVWFIKQTKATQDAARAALEQANHVAASERAWILIHAKKTQLPVLIPIDSLTTEAELHQFANCVYALKNFGHTPAHIILCDFNLQIGTDRLGPPDRQIFNQETKLGIAYPIAPGEPWIGAAILHPDGFIDTAKRSQIMTGAKFLWMCGLVRYLDVFAGVQEIRETKVCLILETVTSAPHPYWIVAGPTEYNKAT